MDFIRLMFLIKAELLFDAILQVGDSCNSLGVIFFISVCVSPALHWK